MLRPARSAIWSATAFLLVASAAAQRRGDGAVVEGDLGRRLEQTVGTVAPGLWGAVLVARAGEVVLAQGYGFADGDRLPNGPRILFDLGGLSSHFTRAAALRLCSDKKLALDEPIGRWLKGVPADKAAITVRHLLEHRSGLPAEVSWGGGASKTARSATQRILGCKLEGEPGTAVHFSHLNHVLLALLVEEAGRGRFEEEVERLLFKPVGMKDTGYVQDRKLDRKRQTLRTGKPGDKNGEPVLDWDWNWAHRGARGLVTTASDLHQWCVTLCGGKVFDEEELELLLLPQQGGDACLVEAVPLGRAELTRLSGAVEGYRARVLLHRQARTWILVLTHRDTDPAVLELALAATLAGDAVAEAVPEPVPDPVPVPAAAPTGERTAEPGADPSRFVGTFVLPVGGRFVVRAEGDRLILLGVGLVAGSRALQGQWPPAGQEAVLRRSEDTGLSHLEKVRADDAAGAAGAFASDDAGVAARNLWRRLVRERGEPLAVRLGGTEPGSKPVSWFEVEFQDAAVWLRAPWADARRLSSLEVVDGGPPFRVELQVLRPDWAEGRTAGGARVAISVEGAGDSRVLVWEDATVGSQGLVECALLR